MNDMAKIIVAVLGVGVLAAAYNINLVSNTTILLLLVLALGAYFFPTYQEHERDYLEDKCLCEEIEHQHALRQCGYECGYRQSRSRCCCK